MAAASKSHSSSEAAASVATAGLLLMIASPGLLAVQGALWLRDGYWTDIKTRSVWLALGGSEPNLAWKGVEQILSWVLDQPLSLSLFGAGLVTILPLAAAAPR